MIKKHLTSFYNSITRLFFMIPKFIHFYSFCFVFEAGLINEGQSHARPWQYTVRGVTTHCHALTLNLTTNSTIPVSQPLLCVSLSCANLSLSPMSQISQWSSLIETTSSDKSVNRKLQVLKGNIRFPLAGIE